MSRWTTRSLMDAIWVPQFNWRWCNSVEGPCRGWLHGTF